MVLDSCVTVAATVLLLLLLLLLLCQSRRRRCCCQSRRQVPVFDAVLHLRQTLDEAFVQRLHLGRSQVAAQLQRRFEDAHLVDDALFQLQHKLVVLRVVDDELGREKRRLFLKLNKIFFKMKQNFL